MTKKEYKEGLKERYRAWQEEKIGIQRLTKEEVEAILKERRAKKEKQLIIPNSFLLHSYMKEHV